nr:Scr1 family TA system antitoxin-like transcriptional regulator [Amycolatopsis cihanbeyliensis]
MAQQQLPPAVMKIVLGNELARQRVDAGLTQDDAAEILRCTQQKIAHIESGSGIRPKELDALLERYGTSEADQAYVRDLQAEGNRRTKRGAFSTRFRQHMRLLVDMEPSCQRFFSYQALVVPGLLQTEQYMRTLFRAWRPSPSRDQIDRDTTDRLARQRVLDNTDQQFWFIIDEAARAASPAVRRSSKSRSCGWSRPWIGRTSSYRSCRSAPVTTWAKGTNTPSSATTPSHRSVSFTWNNTMVGRTWTTPSERPGT